eukprot:TRINITY_DN2405_c0_g1_i1.p1 TRINITY_DN2405_c0_g1~~TRINITY_DN2405_c0_g1_i1.p1  ORF type:complete len:151 (-),score=53.81 TRINITY_DN2405_c0_g1_i1:582-1034(-)
MPGKGSLPNYSEDRREVDVLVHEIKENLNLREHHHFSGPTSSSPLKSGKARKTLRHCPYGVPKLGDHHHRQRRRYPSTSNSDFRPDDPLRMLQELISDGSLIKEAVRRLQLGLSPKLTPGNYYTDSDEDCRSSPAKSIQASSSVCQVGGN